MIGFWGVIVGAMIALIPSFIGPFLQQRAQRKYDLQKNRDELLIRLSQLVNIETEIWEEATRHYMFYSNGGEKTPRNPKDEIEIIVKLNFPELINVFNEYSSAVMKLSCIFYNYNAKKFASRAEGKNFFEEEQGQFFSTEHKAAYEIILDAKTKFIDEIAKLKFAKNNSCWVKRKSKTK